MLLGKYIQPTPPSFVSVSYQLKNIFSQTWFRIYLNFNFIFLKLDENSSDLRKNFPTKNPNVLAENNQTIRTSSNAP